MAIQLQCPECELKFRVKARLRGRRGACPACGHSILANGPRIGKHDVFISFSNEDRKVADSVCHLLEEQSIACWISHRDIAAGMSWASSIMLAISQSPIMVLVYSSHSNNSDQVLNEVERAVHHRVPLIPFRIEDVAPSLGMEYFLSTRHWLDAFTPDKEMHIRELARRISMFLDELGHPRFVSFDTPTSGETHARSAKKMMPGPQTGEPETALENTSQTAQPDPTCEEPVSNNEHHESGRALAEEQLGDGRSPSKSATTESREATSRECLCGEEVAADHTFCISCGLEYVPGLSCADCAATNRPEFDFCIHCGCPLNAT